MTLAVLGQHGIDVTFTLNGGHVRSFCDAARTMNVAVIGPDMSSSR